MTQTYTARSSKKRIRLDTRIAGGGEGEVYTVAHEPLIAAKLYHTACRTPEREQKIRRLLAKRIPIKTFIAMRVALPLDIIEDARGDFVGYVMPKIDAVPVKTALFSKARIERYFPNQDRRGLADFALAYLKQVKFLHAKGILIGDINPQNILVERKEIAKSWLIDTDSFQVDELPCPVGTDVFTPARLQGKDFSRTLRTEVDEMFSVAIMLFMILMIGKHPYARVGGSEPAQNIRDRAFSYPKGIGSMVDIPKGVWGFIWSNFDKTLKEAFYSVFAEGEALSVDAWIAILKKHRYLLEKAYIDRALFPKSYRVFEPVDVVCSRCDTPFQIEKWWHKTLARSGKAPLCSHCQQRAQAATLAKKSARRRQALKRERLECETEASRGLFSGLLRRFG